ncbi:Molybdopterin biosynthesis MoaE [Microdochium trichocladiopsis]|uniref:Molybdopterin synthase catalytic subunit n=1 Tax=Microdochium trichocladiopsis TaxID=1682393 RepID=A0A9P9BXV4_9PEZI|nr:Molybdopterin biosynthesis MoaE [Microdochium trichocladiopsis]KAH7037423.1 Molybdopterin biosynthesis MoaE [Microdochium trichocladiopsis]
MVWPQPQLCHFRRSESHSDIKFTVKRIAAIAIAGMDSGSTTELEEQGCYVALTHNHLNAQDVIDRVRSPKAGAIVLFAGTTRDNFAGKPVKELQYSSYGQLALRTMMSISKAMVEKHSLTSIAMIHRLGTVPIAEESILIAVSSPHRQAAWRAGEEALEECKARVEVWKKEEFDGEEGVWRANRDGAPGQKMTEQELNADQSNTMS